MAKVTKLPSPGPDDPIFSAPAIVSVPIARPRTPLPEDSKRRLDELRAQDAASDDAEESA